MNLSDSDIQVIYQLIYKLIGTERVAEERAKVFITNIKRRISLNNAQSLNEYLYIANNDANEFKHLISSLTIHTTYWYRESIHYTKVMQYIKNSQYIKLRSKLSVTSFGCSTGEEAYSLALMLEHYNDTNTKKIDYKLYSHDIDPVSVDFANRGIYNKTDIKKIPNHLHKFLLFGSGKTEDFFAIKKDIRKRCEFAAKSILTFNPSSMPTADIIFCRNILIYFKPNQIVDILSRFYKMLRPGGIIVLGHSEGLIDDDSKYIKHGNTIFEKIDKNASKLNIPMSLDEPKKSAIPRFVSHTNSEKKIALPFAKTNEKIIEKSKDYSKNQEPHKVSSDISLNVRPKNVKYPDLIVIGASTGGTEALTQLLQNFGAFKATPPLLVVQHIPPEFAAAFAKKLATVSQIKLSSMEPNVALEKNHLYMATGDYHIGVKKTGSVLRLELSQTPPMASHRPAVDFLFNTVAKIKGIHVLAALLTGMGKDGAMGMKRLKDQGALTLAQDEESSTVFGMPKEAIRLKAVDYKGNLSQIRLVLNDALNDNDSKTKKVAS